jgi:hypothetical protein
MKTSEIVAVSDAIAARQRAGALPIAGPITKRRGLEVSVEPTDPRHADVVLELDPRDPSGDRVKAVRVQFREPEAARWDQLEDRFGPLTKQAAYLDAPEKPPVRVGHVRPRAGGLGQMIRVDVDDADKVVGFTVRELFD